MAWNVWKAANFDFHKIFIAKFAFTLTLPFHVGSPRNTLQFNSASLLYWKMFQNLLQEETWGFLMCIVMIWATSRWQRTLSSCTGGVLMGWAGGEDESSHSEFRPWTHSFIVRRSCVTLTVTGMCVNLSYSSSSCTHSGFNLPFHSLKYSFSSFLHKHVASSISLIIRIVLKALYFK